MSSPKELLRMLLTKALSDRQTGSAMRQSHLPSERVLVEFSGRRPSCCDVDLGRGIDVELFVGALGYRSTEPATQVCYRCGLPIPMFKIPGRQGWSAAATAVAAWLDTQNLRFAANAPTGTEGEGQTSEHGGAPWPDH